MDTNTTDNFCSIGSMIDFRKEFWAKNGGKSTGGFRNRPEDFLALDAVKTNSVVDNDVMESILSRFSDRLDTNYYFHKTPEERDVLEFSFGVYDVQFVEWEHGYYMTVVAQGDDGRKYCRTACVDLDKGDFKMKDEYLKKPEFIFASNELRAKSDEFQKEHGIE